jgi:hypothetical protein
VPKALVKAKLKENEHRGVSFVAMAARPKEVARARAASESSTQGSDEDDGDDGDSDVGMRDAEGVGDVAAGCAAGMDDGAAGPRPQRAGKEDVDPSAGTRGLPSAAAVARGAAPPRVEGGVPPEARCAGAARAAPPSVVAKRRAPLDEPARKASARAVGGAGGAQMRWRVTARGAAGYILPAHCLGEPRALFLFSENDVDKGTNKQQMATQAVIRGMFRVSVARVASPAC